MYAISPRGSGSVTVGAELGKGGEGSVFAVDSLALPGLTAGELVAKLYHEPERESRAEKLKAMVSNPVHDAAVAWPVALVLDEQKRFIGYLMPRLSSRSYREWLYVANAKDRRTVAPDFDTRYAYAAVRNLAAALLAVHAVGHRVGDINESNIFLGADATVLIVDTDSMQVKGPNGNTYACSVGKPEFTAPELAGGSLREIPRTVETDIFAFAVAAYQLLTGGATPHQGVFDPNNPEDPPSQSQRIRLGILPSLKPESAKALGFSPRPGVPTAAFPQFLREHLIAFLSPEPSQRNSRYSLSSLVEALDAFIGGLVRCAREPQHWYAADVGFCGWCAAASESSQDPWAAVALAPAQAKLRPIDFKQQNIDTAVSRAPAGGARSAPAAQSSAAASSATSSTAASAQASVPAPPKKIKGKVTVQYADGSWAVRPPLMQLIRHNPKIALWALKQETPEPLKFWWPVNRDLVNLLALPFGLVLAALSASGWWFLSYSLLTHMSFLQLTSASAGLLALAPVATVLLATAIFFSSALNDQRKTRSRYGTLSGFKRESFPKTLLRFLPLVLFYGIPAVLLLLFGLVYVMFIFVRAVVRA